jgi:hypothetical protein
MLVALTFLLACVPQFNGIENASSGSLQKKMADRNLPAQARVQMLEELAGRNGGLNYDLLVEAKGVARGEWVADYVRCLGRCGEPAIPDLEKYVRSRTSMVKAEAVYGLTMADLDDGDRFAMQILRNDKQPTIARVAALRGLADRGSILAHVEAVRRLSTAQGSLLLEAIDIIGRNPCQDDIRYLIKVVDEREGRARHSAVALLQEITGYKIGADARSWKYFFLKHRTEGTDFRHPKADDGEESHTLSYMGIPLLGDKVIFVLDSSGSMNSGMAETQHSRGKRAVGELVRLLPNLPKQARFDVIFFSDRVSRLSAGKLLANEEARINSATRWLESNDFDGGTNLFGGLEKAFHTDDVEEIILLTDGMPSAGAIQQTSRILSWVQRRNRWKNVRVSTIGLSAPHESGLFLGKLAQQNSGVYRAIR